MSFSFLKLNTPKIVHQNLDNEVIIIHLESGCYYSLNSTAAFIWSVLEKGMEKAAIIETVQNHYQGDPKLIEKIVSDWLSRLLSENLALDSTSEMTPAQEIPPPKEKKAFTPPEIEKYTDMQEYIMLDPIHEVGEKGWPSEKPNPSPKKPS